MHATTRAATVRFSLGLPQVLSAAGPSLLQNFATRAEELQFDGLWTIDNATGGPTSAQPVLDAIHALTYVAGTTTKIRLGTAVLVLPRRNPVQLAKELATLDQLSAGRLVVGVGTGRDDGTVAPLGFPVDRPVGRLIEGVAVMRAVWTQDAAEHDGELWNFTGARVAPKPIQRPVPVWFGALGPKSLRRAAEHADGWIGAGASSIEDFAKQAVLLKDALRAEGRDWATFPRAKRVYIGIESTKEEARRRLVPALDGLYDAPGLTERTGVYGSVDECAEVLRQLHAAGADELVLTPVYDHQRQLMELSKVVACVRDGGES
jgi:probable F420-dependent oxidoreductase